MKWTHSICFKDYFVSEWQAAEDAFILANEFGMSSYIAGSSRTFPAKISGKGSSRVSFAPEVEVALCYLQEGLNRMTIPENDFHKWIDKPWTLKSSKASTTYGESYAGTEMHFRTTDAFYNVLPRWATDGRHEQGEHGAGEADDFFLHDAPQPVQTLFEFFLQQDIMDGPRLAETIYLRSWYLHRLQVPQWFHPRTLELHGHCRGWLRDILSGWQDMVIADEDVDLYICRPDPPRQGNFFMDVLIVQGNHIPNFAGLITVLQSNERTARERYSVATTFPPFVSGNQVAISSHAIHECHLRTCTIRHGHNVIPFNADPVHEMRNGDTFTLQGNDQTDHPADADIESEQAHEEEDELIEEDREEEGDQAPGDDEPDFQSSDESHNGDPQALHVMRLGHPTIFGHVDWRSYHVVLREAAQLVGAPLHQFVGFHYLQTPLIGQQLAEETIILQHINDIAIGSQEKLIVVDIVMHVERRSAGLPAAPTVSRRVFKVLPQLTRSQMLIVAGVEHYCQWSEHQCVAHRNGIMWPYADHQLRDMEHGMYVRIQLPPPQQQHWEPTLAIQAIQEAGDLFDFPEAGWIAADLLQGRALDHDQAAALPCHAPRHQQCKPCEIIEDIDVPLFFAPGTRMPRHRPRHDGGFDWWYQLGEMFSQFAEQEAIDGDHYLYLQTWFVHHERHRVCRQPRPIRLDGAAYTWIEEFRFLWRDLLQRDVPFSIHIIKPRPPQPRLQTYTCHVVIEQARPHGRAAGVVTNLFEGPERDAMEQFATTLPSRVRRDDVIEEMQLQHFTEGRRVEVRVGSEVVHLIIATDLSAGFSMRIRFGVPANLPQTQRPVHPGQAEMHFEDVAFFQKQARIVLSRLPNVDAREGRYVDSDIVAWMRRRSQRLTRSPLYCGNAPQDVKEVVALDQAIEDRIPDSGLHLLQQTQFIQDLFAIWNAAAFAWAGEERAGSILTWFVDHRQGFPICHLPRLVVLFENFPDWKEAICRQWEDSIDRSQEIEFHHVAPLPEHLEPDIVAHVIVIQAPRRGAATNLVSI